MAKIQSKNVIESNKKKLQLLYNKFRLRLFQNLQEIKKKENKY